MTPRVSVVVPAYNSVGYLAATVDSILGQTFTDFELIISDHSSTDGSWELLQRYADEPRVTLTRQPAGGGAAANWNAVTAAATGEYVKLVCSDDLLYPHALAEQVAALDAHPGAVLAAARRDIVDARGEVLIKSRGLQGIEGPISRHGGDPAQRAGRHQRVRRAGLRADPTLGAGRRGQLGRELQLPDRPGELRAGAGPR